MFQKNINKNFRDEYFSFTSWVIPISLAVFLIILSFNNYLFFHTLAEFFSIIIAVLMGVVAWQMYPFTRNNFLMYLGIGYFLIGILDLLHTISYKGMNIIPNATTSTAVEFWIGTRYLEGL